MLIEDITNLGSGVGRVDLSDGSKWVIMVPNVIAGEKVKVKIYKNYDSYSEGELVEVQTASPDRVDAPCPYFSTCGGCQYQHITIATQRRWKKAQVLNVLRRIGQLTLEDKDVNDVVGTDHHYGYRTKLTPHYDVPRARKAVKIGFQMKGSRNIVDIDQCIIASSLINTKYADERQRIIESIEVS